MKLRNSNCDKTQKLQTQIAIKVESSNCDKTQKLKW